MVPPEQQQQHHDPGDDYVNPLEKSPRWVLATQALALRSGASLGFGISNLCTPATATTSVKSIWLNAKLGRWKAKGAVSVDIWSPPPVIKMANTANGDANTHVNQSRRGRGQSHDSASAVNTKASATSPPPLRPAIINFHGGGFILGQGTDDARWACAASAAVDAVVFSVNYRLAPSYPFPTAVEDCVSAVTQICSSSDLLTEYRVDRTRIMLSGFSAGGTLALASWVVLQSPGDWGYDVELSSYPSSAQPSPPSPPPIAGLVLFYPMLDCTIGRPYKRSMCPRPDLTLPKSLTDLIDASYLYPPLPCSARGDLRLSPGLMPDALLKQLPPLHLCLCEYDMLLAEGLAFADRARTVLGRCGGGDDGGKSENKVEVRIVQGEKHAWDKPPPMASKESVVAEYNAAISSIKGWLGSHKGGSVE